MTCFIDRSGAIHFQESNSCSGLADKEIFDDWPFNFNKNLAFGYINSGMSHQEIENSEFEIEVEKKKFKASILKRPLNSKKLSET